jgi:ubiquinone/menaquinone biosynthesis C-methylase UbiE
MSGQTLPNENQQKRYSDAIHEAKNQGIDAFQSWFNLSENRQQSIVRGYWDFSMHILTPTVCKLMSEPERKTALEIGFGGGRLLNAACKYFQFAIGVDIHGEQAFVGAFLKEEGNQNFKLLRTSSNEIGIEANSVDFVYSFIVLQHLPTLNSLTGYLEEIHRVLKPNGVAQLYFGKFNKLKPAAQLKSFWAGYKEISDAPVNHVSLVLRVGKMRRLCQAYGFEVVDCGPSYKTVPDGFPKSRGGQTYVTLVRK